LAGSPDIAAAIFGKIDQSSVFVCDVSIVNPSAGKSRPSPNPNVLIELGYAIARLGWENIILILNEEYGGIEQLPFDLRARRILKYRISPEAQDKASERSRVCASLQAGIRSILLNVPQRREKSGTTQVGTHTTSKQDKSDAQSKLKVIMNLPQGMRRSQMLLENAEEHLNRNRYDLAVIFASKLPSGRRKFDLLTAIADGSMGLRDADTAQKAISGLPQGMRRSQMAQQLLGIMERP